MTAAATLLRDIALPTKVKPSGRRATLLVARADGTYGMRRPRTHEERETVSINQRARAITSDKGFWAVARTLPGNGEGQRKSGRPSDHPTWVMLLIASLATQCGSQRAATTYVKDPGYWMFFRAYAHAHKPAGFRAAGTKPPARHHFTHFMRKWESPEWAEHRANAEKAGKGYALSVAKRLGHFNPNQPLEYARVDSKQWATLDGTVYQAPSKRTRDQGGRCDPASGWHSKGGAPNGLAYGSKYSIVETLSDEYQGQLILAFKHVDPRPGNTQGDEAAASEYLLHELKKDAPGLRGAVSDSAFRGTHIKRLTRAGVIVINYPVAAANPNRESGGRLAEGRVERTRKVRTHTHKGRDGRVCRHVLHVVGSVPSVEAIDAEGNTILMPLAPSGYQSHINADGSHVFYLVTTIECRRGNTRVLIRLDDHARGDIQGWSRADLVRFYPVGTPQFDYLYGRRNTSESLHAKMKRTMPRLPAYGRTRQDLFMLGYQVANNAIALAFHAQRGNLPNALDGTT